MGLAGPALALPTKNCPLLTVPWLLQTVGWMPKQAWLLSEPQMLVAELGPRFCLETPIVVPAPPGTMMVTPLPPAWPLLLSCEVQTS